jgi:hypothetical protein
MRIVLKADITESTELDLQKLLDRQSVSAPRSETHPADG